MADVRWVALVLVGGGSGDTEGARDLCASIFHFEPSVLHVLLVAAIAGKLLLRWRQLARYTMAA